MLPLRSVYWQSTCRAQARREIERKLGIDDKLPDPPWRVYGKVAGKDWGPTWLIYHGYLWFTCFGIAVASRNVTVVDHPRNDHEAVAMIAKAKEGK